jgi:hypothetical protein
MDDTLADLVEPGATRIAMCLLRRYVSSTGTLIASYNWHPADRFSYRMVFDRNDQP